MTTIPERLTDLKYSKHAIRERCFEEFGVIESVPKHFIRVGCKRVTPSTKDGVIKATYIYNDTRDITLVIHVESKTVITNYLSSAQNAGVYKGRYRINTFA